MGAALISLAKHVVPQEWSPGVIVASILMILTPCVFAGHIIFPRLKRRADPIPLPCYYAVREEEERERDINASSIGSLACPGSFKDRLDEAKLLVIGGGYSSRSEYIRFGSMDPNYIAIGATGLDEGIPVRESFYWHETFIATMPRTDLNEINSPTSDAMLQFLETHLHGKMFEAILDDINCSSRFISLIEAHLSPSGSFFKTGADTPWRRTPSDVHVEKYEARHTAFVKWTSQKTVRPLGNLTSFNAAECFTGQIPLSLYIGNKRLAEDTRGYLAYGPDKSSLVSAGIVELLEEGQGFGNFREEYRHPISPAVSARTAAAVGGGGGGGGGDGGSSGGGGGGSGGGGGGRRALSHQQKNIYDKLSVCGLVTIFDQYKVFEQLRMRSLYTTSNPEHFPRPRVHAWRGQGLRLSTTCFHDGALANLPAVAPNEVDFDAFFEAHIASQQIHTHPYMPCYELFEIDHGKEVITFAPQSMRAWLAQVGDST